ncbi:uncharacterized protein HMPREF1541_05084 [Cyphellophora europaea CBS 101466]|uniref:Uncharacterized protein n=1 Tax=Cyphellophora europaea (strain CBS 101466) TaxID=1220924 RepID=W2RYP1_CYPE1|nr:uncharacterized protein HMPREF1541_05084 [Cyphellophora europaea CBS 101466]ETN40804.1 hypothetical protein HMPREF1541_05084 [Cyphellophora europaea CBS 101466]
MLLPRATSLRFARQSSRATSCLRSVATASAKAKRTRTTALPQSGLRQNGGSTAARPGQQITHASLKAKRARQLYDQGVRLVYEAPAFSGRILGAWFIGACFVGYAVNLVSLRHWDMSTLHGMGSWQKNFIAGGNRVSMFFLTFMGGFAIFRYCGFIRSIRLVDLGAGNIKLGVHVRRRMPWSETRFTVAAGELSLPHRWQQRLNPSTETTASRNLTAMLSLPYTWLKSWLLMDGVIAPVTVGTGAIGQLDSAGKFEVSLADFNAITTERSPT